MGHHYVGVASWIMGLFQTRAPFGVLVMLHMYFSHQQAVDLRSLQQSQLNAQNYITRLQAPSEPFGCPNLFGILNGPRNLG